MKWSNEQVDQLIKMIDVNNDGKIAIWECIVGILSIKSKAMKKDLLRYADATVADLRDKAWISKVVKDCMIKDTVKEVCHVED